MQKNNKWRKGEITALRLAWQTDEPPLQDQSLTYLPRDKPTLDWRSRQKGKASL